MRTYITFTYVDAVTRIPLTEAPAHSGPTNPDGAVFGFALESRYPTSVPTFYGWTEGETDVAGIFSIVSKEEYDAAYEQEMLDRVPPPLPPIRLTVGELVNRFRIPEENDAFARLEDAMDLESRLVRRQWANDATVMTEGEGLWTIIAGHLDSIVTPQRKAELLARPGAGAAFAGEAIAA